MVNSEPSPPTNALDLVLRYGAGLAAIAYALGFLVHASFVGVTAVSVPLADSDYFINGLLVEFLCVAATIVGILSREFIGHLPVLLLDRQAPRWLGINRSTMYRAGETSGSAIVSFAFMLIVGKTKFDLSFGWALAISVACGLVNAIVALILLNPDAYLSPTVRQQLSLLMIVGIGFALFSIGFGIAQGRRAL